MANTEHACAIGLVVEAPADARTVRFLIDRTLCEEVEWIDDALVEHLRIWRGAEPATSLLLWKQVRRLCEEHGVRIHGHFGGEPGAPDARAARRVIALFATLGAPDALVLVRDADNQPQRREGRRHGMRPERIVIGVANPEREAWHLCGFEPASDDERRTLASERERLGFDPTLQPERLGGEGKRNAKLVLETLTSGDHDREHCCLDAPLDRLRSRGVGCGLDAFLTEIGERIVLALADSST